MTLLWQESFPPAWQIYSSRLSFYCLKYRAPDHTNLLNGETSYPLEASLL